MKISARFDRSRMAQRGGFTFVELMVVVIIIAVLMGLAASATMKYMTSQQIANTQSTLDRVHSQLARAWSKVKDQAYKEQIPPAIAAWIQVNMAQIGPSDPNVMGRVRVIYVKLRMRQAFPMSFNEALYPPTLPNVGACPMPALPAYQRYLNNLGITGSSAATAPYESSACVLMALQRGVSGAGINAADLTSGGAAGNYNGVPFLADAWGRPIFFSRVPVGSPTLNTIPWPGLGQPGANDPLDPLSYLQTVNWSTSVGTSGLQYGVALTLVTQQQIAGPGNSYKQAPMVASGGQDNWVKSTNLTFHPTTFAPGYYSFSSGTFTPGTMSTGVQYSNSTP